jgi:Na+/H+-dicarboxylate symporter
MKMWVKVTIALVAGIVAGFALGDHATALKPVGDVFINLLKMIVIPLVFASMVMGISKSDPHRVGRVGIKALWFFAVNIVLTVAFGMGTTYLLGLGKDLHLVSTGGAPDAPPLKLADLFVNIVPKNPIAAFAEGNVIQVLFFAILFAISLKALGDFGKPIVNFFEVLAHLMFKMAGLIMELAPYGVFALMAWAIGSFGLGLLIPVFKFLVIYTLAAIIYAIVVYSFILRGFAKLSPIKFLRGMTEPITMALSTCSSAATLPFSIRNTVNNLGISENFASFSLPLAMNLNFNGSTLFLGMATPFIAYAYGVPLSAEQLVIVFIMIVFTNFTSAALPSGDILKITVIFAAVGLPIEGIALLASVDRLRDMVTTAMNVTANATVCTYLAKQEGELNETTYNCDTSQVCEGAL